MQHSQCRYPFLQVARSTALVHHKGSAGPEALPSFQHLPWVAFPKPLHLACALLLVRLRCGPPGDLFLLQEHHLRPHPVLLQRLLGLLRPSSVQLMGSSCIQRALHVAAGLGVRHPGAGRPCPELPHGEKLTPAFWHYRGCVSVLCATSALCRRAMLHIGRGIHCAWWHPREGAAEGAAW